jgi:hypothetical protein
MALMQQLAASSGIQLADGSTPEPSSPAKEAGLGQLPTGTRPKAPSEEGEDEPEPPTPPAAAAAPAREEPPKDRDEYMQRLAARDAKLVAERQRAKQLEQRVAEYEEFDKAMRSGRAAEALHSRYRLGYGDLSRQFLDAPTLPGGQPQAQPGGIDLSGLTPELQKALAPVLQKVGALEQQNAELAKKAQALDEREQTQAMQVRRTEDISRVGKYLGGLAEALPLVNDLDLSGQVYDQYCEHIKLHGAPETDKEVAFELERIAREVEQTEAARITALLEKPRAKQFLLRAIGAQKEAKPARQETRAPNGRSNGAAPAVPNSLATQRASRTPPTDWASLSHDEQLRRTVELATQ